jgi:hypothetical protein
VRLRGYTWWYRRYVQVVGELCADQMWLSNEFSHTSATARDARLQSYAYAYVRTLTTRNIDYIISSLAIAC